MSHFRGLSSFHGFGSAPAVAADAAHGTYAAGAVFALAFSAAGFAFGGGFFFVEAAEGYVAAVVVHFDFDGYGRGGYVVSAAAAFSLGG